MTDTTNAIGCASETEFPRASEAIARLLSPESVRAQVRAALNEDVGSGDRTAALIAETAVSEVRVVWREKAVICGTAWFDEVFRRLDHRIRIRWTLPAAGSFGSAEVLTCSGVVYNRWLNKLLFSASVVLMRREALPMPCIVTSISTWEGSSWSCLIN